MDNCYCHNAPTNVMSGRKVPTWLDDILPSGLDSNEALKVAKEVSSFDRDPTLDDNLSKGFKKGYVWINSKTKEAFINVESSPTAATWKIITEEYYPILMDRNPKETDSFSNYRLKPGRIWINYSTDEAFILLYTDGTRGVWKSLTSLNTIVQMNRYPTSDDKDYKFLTFWICTQDDTIWCLTNPLTGVWQELSNINIDGGTID